VAIYRIIVTKANLEEDGQVKDWDAASVIIDASTQYLLEQDIPEWIKAEIDPGAEVTEGLAKCGFTHWPEQVVTFDLGGRVLEITGSPAGPHTYENGEIQL
jgi:hypothetical protein